MPSHLYAVRHAKVIKPKGVLYGQTDYIADLSDEIGLTNLSSKIPINCVWHSSPLRRALMTAHTVAAIRGYDEDKILISDHLREQNYGILERASLSDVFSKFPNSSTSGKIVDNPRFKPPGGETYMELVSRAQIWMASISVTSPRNHVAFCHRGVIQAFMHVTGYSINDELWNLDIPYLSVTKIII